MTFDESRRLSDLEMTQIAEETGRVVPLRQNSMRQPSSRQHSIRLGLTEPQSIDIDIPDKAPPNFETLLEIAVEEQLVDGKHSSGFGWALAACMIGQTMEFFDFSVYAFFAPEIGKLFFPKGNAALRAVETFSVFAGGFMMRPLGSVLLGAVGDRYGTAVALRWSIALMCVPTVVTGCLPTVHQIGPAATILLTLMRLLQGMSVGGELIGAILHTSDHKRAGMSRGFYCGVVAACGGLGNLLGSGVSSLTHRALSEAEILRWGWRVPFLCGSLLGVVGFFLRSQGSGEHTAASSPSAEAQPSTAVEEEGKVEDLQRSPSASTEAAGQSCWDVFRSLRKEDVPNLLLVVILSGLINIMFYTNLVWLGTYLSTLAPRPIAASDAFAVLCLFQACCLILVPAWGFLGDRTGGRLMYVTVGCLAAAVAQPLLWMLLLKGSAEYAMYFALALAPIHTMVMSGNFWGWVAEAFHDCPARYLCIGVAYNVGAMLGGSYPMIASALSTSDFHLAPVLPISAFAVLTFVVLIYSGKYRVKNAKTSSARDAAKLQGSKTTTLPPQQPSSSQ